MNVTATERMVIRHALGLDNSKNAYRNHFCACIADPNDDTGIVRALVDRGLMEPGPVINDGRDQYFRVTDAGKRAVGVKDAKP